MMKMTELKFEHLLKFQKFNFPFFFDFFFSKNIYLYNNSNDK